MNWGNRLVVVFTAFVALIGTLVYKATHTKYELVSKDYYKDELRYQEKIDGMNNAAKAGNIQLQQSVSELQLTLPEQLKDVSGEADAWFYCRTNASLDKKVKARIENGMFRFDTRGWAAGSYELKLQFSDNSKSYYYTEPVSISQ